MDTFEQLCDIIRLTILNLTEVVAMAKDKRFAKIYSQELGSTEIWVDKVTGVNYLFHAAGYAGGLTVLLNRDGTPVVTPLPKTYEE